MRDSHFISDGEWTYKSLKKKKKKSLSFEIHTCVGPAFKGGKQDKRY